ncbi:MAG: 30S ribosomal protein S1 [Desulfobulbus sp.]|uniref:30S ribosomal protein S1 n=1 Tax=uncultured Desulfobulbus sp. TaxID=239745 RepID=UPI001B579481|nr:30S ribosomal protein S1 [uncultured Desulfobulbus sp.]MBP7517439.1 30S ribosomal protein S1 [Desulfobulbus sp.]
MSDESFADLFQAKTVSRPTMKPGDRIEATVVGISGENIFLDVGAKSEGVLAAAELRNEAGELTVGIGDRVRVYLLPKRGGEMACTTRLGGGQTTPREIEEAFEAGIPVEGKVTAEVKGGFSVTVAGHRCFCPYSQMDIRRVEQADSYLDKTLAFKIMEFGSQGRNIILSARALQEEQRAREREQLKEQLREGVQVSGTVTSVRDFGAFVDIGGVDGLIPISELAWGQTDRVEDVLSLGQQVQVVVKRLDWDRDRISLSLRETTENPWDKAAERYPAGSVHQGRVSRLAAFGAFVTLEAGVDGLLHISRLGAGRRIHHPREVVEVGQELTVKIESVDTAQQRIALVPEDYAPREKTEDTPVPPAPREPVSMGTLGDLLKQQLGKKKK